MSDWTSIPGRRVTAGAFVSALAAVFFLPIVFGPVAMIMGGVAWARGDRMGCVAMLVAVFATILGMALGAAAVLSGLAKFQ